MTWLKTLLHLHPKAIGNSLKQTPSVDDWGCWLLILLFVCVNDAPSNMGCMCLG
jgi:hypothetical protein